ncbi:hypothetical protein [Polaribacter cellanae]|uniref:Uncharacterized protein n=1 Tax=Polaribacter cellanae TaxID=2818493 RepID=A0A975H6E7_9FLAO|nr:hypothetical protein [Polaribacter cellanae]QTE21839.1 hypothetical protein J3359_13580 [Polaribacter cellanae]
MKTLTILIISVTIFSNLNNQLGNSNNCLIDGKKNLDISKSSRNITQRVEGTNITLRTTKTIGGNDDILKEL